MRERKETRDERGEGGGCRKAGRGEIDRGREKGNEATEEAQDSPSYEWCWFYANYLPAMQQI